MVPANVSPALVRRLLLCWLSVGVCVLTGCGTRSTGQPEGKITLQGRPVPNAGMQWVSLADPDRSFRGASSRDGTYQVHYDLLDGLPVGQYTVTVTYTALPSGVPFPAGELADSLRSEGTLIMPAFAFQKEVRSGRNHIDFDLADGQKLTEAREIADQFP